MLNNETEKRGLIKYFHNDMELFVSYTWMTAKLVKIWVTYFISKKLIKFHNLINIKNILKFLLI